MSGGKLLVYLVRHDLRTADNPILHHLATTNHGFSFLLPVFVLPPSQIEVSGFLTEGEKSPYPPALSKVGKFWRCGPHRATFLAQSVWDLKTKLEFLESGLIVRIGSYTDVVRSLIEAFKGSHHHLGAVWMTKEVSFEEEQDEISVSSVCFENGVHFKLWPDEKYFIDDRDTGLQSPQHLPDIFTTYRKTQEPLRQRPRRSLLCPAPGSLPAFPHPTWTPPQRSPFAVPNTYEEFELCLLKPIRNMLSNPTDMPPDAKSAHPFQGGESNGRKRVHHLVKTGGMVHYSDTRNGLVGVDYSTKLSGYLALGCITARQVHEEMVKLEDGLDPVYALSKGFNRGENEGTKAVRFELLWRDYMRLCTMKFGYRLFRISGFRGETGNYQKKWKTANARDADVEQDPTPKEIQVIIDRFLEGRTGMGLIDASQRELYHTGYTSNRARQNVASFFAKHLGIDWRYGAEWYEAMLIDYDVSSNWANWQYVSGVGNDPRGDARIFNPIKQAFDYDNNGAYVRTWVPEVKDLERLENVFQVWTTDEDELEKYGLSEDLMVTDPLKRIEFLVDRKPRGPRRPFRLRRGGGNRGRRGGGSGNGSGGGGGGGGSSGSAASGEQNDGQQRGRPPTEKDKENTRGVWCGDSIHVHGNPGTQTAGPWPSRGRGQHRGNQRNIPPPRALPNRGPPARGPAWGFSQASYVPSRQFPSHPLNAAQHPTSYPPSYGPAGYHHPSHMGRPI